MEPTDIELMLRVREGDVTAFRELTARHREPLQRFFASLLADRSLADDYTQETLFRLWRTRERYEPSGSFSAYLFQIARHFWWNQRKKFRRDPSPVRLEEAMAETAFASRDPQAVALGRDRLHHLLSAVSELPARYRVVFELCQFEEMSYAEVAAQLGIPLGTVKSRMSEALRRLRRAVDALDAEEGHQGDEAPA